MKIFRTSQIKELDAFTIAYEPISSYNLMKRAVNSLFEVMLPMLDRDIYIVIFAGPGNNGGDALVLARFLTMIGQPIIVYLFDNGKLSQDCSAALSEAEEFGIDVLRNCELSQIEIPKKSIIVDGLFGAGLSRPLEGDFLELVELINKNYNPVWSIDIPSGLMGEDNRKNNSNGVIKAEKTFTFQQPKLSFYLADSATFVGDVYIIPIGMHPKAITETKTDYYLTDKTSVSLKHRQKFSHKGTYGHALLIAGKYGMAGAAILSSRSTLRMGCGLLTVHIPSHLYEILQISVPEAIIELDRNNMCFSGVDAPKQCSALGIGPGLGTSQDSYIGLKQVLEIYNDKTFVLDADALNIISEHKQLLLLLPEKSIITPHPKEFDRLCGASTSSYERLEKAIQLAKEYNIIVVLKGAHTCIALPDGSVRINSTGNAGMATAGSGDVLTGIILSLLAQNYKPEDAAVIGVFIHGLAGDKAAAIKTEEALIASDIIDYMPEAIKAIKDLGY